MKNPFIVVENITYHSDKTKTHSFTVGEYEHGTFHPYYGTYPTREEANKHAETLFTKYKRRFTH